MTMWMKLFSLGAAVLALASCGPRGHSKAGVDAAAAQDDPAKLALEAKVTGYIESTRLPSNIETGIVTLGDGERVKFWFKSRHFDTDFGCTRFEYGDGSVDYLEGFFCCEMDLPGARLGNRKELREFIERNDGSEP